MKNVYYILQFLYLSEVNMLLSRKKKWKNSVLTLATSMLLNNIKIYVTI